MSGIPARVDLSNGAEDVVFFVNGTATVANMSSVPVLAFCDLRDDTTSTPRPFGMTRVTVPAASGSNFGYANVAMSGWAVVWSGSVSPITVECTLPIEDATVVGTRVGLFNIQ